MIHRYWVERNTRFRRRLLDDVCALCISYGTIFASAQTSRFQFLREPGSYPVGMKVVYQYDRSHNYSVDGPSRPTAGDETRPLQTLV
jgi:hypothetical protein